MRLALRGAPLALALLGCGGGDGNDPGDLFPAVAGTYQVDGTFDDLPPEDAHFEGTLTLTQATTETGDLEGSLSLLVTIGTDIFSISDDALVPASVSTSGVVAFTLADPSGTWTFSGTAAGTSITDGRHTLSDGTNTLSGSWQANPAATVRVARAAPADFRDLLHRLADR